MKELTLSNLSSCEGESVSAGFPKPLPIWRVTETPCPMLKACNNLASGKDGHAATPHKSSKDQKVIAFTAPGDGQLGSNSSNDGANRRCQDEPCHDADDGATIRGCNDLLRFLRRHGCNS